MLYNCSVSKRPTIASQTKEASIEPGTETLSLSADPREDGLVKARTGDDTTNAVYQAWYESVYTPAVSSGSGINFNPVFILILNQIRSIHVALHAGSDVTRQEVRRAIPDDYDFVLDELMHSQEDEAPPAPPQSGHSAQRGRTDKNRQEEKSGLGDGRKADAHAHAAGADAVNSHWQSVPGDAGAVGVGGDANGVGVIWHRGGFFPMNGWCSVMPREPSELCSSLRAGIITDIVG